MTKSLGVLFVTKDYATAYPLTNIILSPFFWYSSYSHTEVILINDNGYQQCYTVDTPRIIKSSYSCFINTPGAQLLKWEITDDQYKVIIDYIENNRKKVLNIGRSLLGEWISPSEDSITNAEFALAILKLIGVIDLPVDYITADDLYEKAKNVNPKLLVVKCL
jgi:hypothetical protein